MFDWIGDFFLELFNLIPKLMYLMNTSLLSLVDFLQLLFRKLAGLDIYYVDGEKVNGDLLTNFIGGILGIDINGLGETAQKTDYSILSTVFWSFVIFGLIILFISTIVAIIKSHYSYNEKSAKGPLPIVATAGKAVINMVAVPIIVILGLYLSQAILNALDQITSVGSDDLLTLYGSSEEGASQEYGVAQLVQGITDSQGNETYIFYDMFGWTGKIWYGLGVIDFGIATREEMSGVAARTQPFSGSMFKVAAYNANRVRKHQFTYSDKFTGNGGGGLNLFIQHDNSDAKLATMVDEAFANFLHLDKSYDMVYGIGNFTSERFFTTWTTTHACAFSKFNVGLVWYYYNLWDYNFVVGFGAVIVCLSIFLNIIMGLMARLVMALVLFLVMPPLAGLAPLDDGNAFKGWTKNFMSQALMAYGAVVGMNLVLLILPYINGIDFFNIPMVDILVQTLFVIVGLVTIKAVIATLSQLIGAADANKTGADMHDEVKGTMIKAGLQTARSAMVAGGVTKNLVQGAGKLAIGAGAAVGNLGIAAGNAVRGARANREAKKAEKELSDAQRAVKKDKMIQEMSRKDLSQIDKKEFDKIASDNGLSRKEAKQMWASKRRAEKNANSATADKTSYKNRADFMRQDLAKSDEAYKKEYDRMQSSRNNIELGRARRANEALLKQKAVTARNEAKVRNERTMRRLNMARDNAVGGLRDAYTYGGMAVRRYTGGLSQVTKMGLSAIWDEKTEDMFKKAIVAVGIKPKKQDYLEDIYKGLKKAGIIKVDEK